MSPKLILFSILIIEYSEGGSMHRGEIAWLWLKTGYGEDSPSPITEIEQASQPLHDLEENEFVRLKWKYNMLRVSQVAGM